MPTIHQQLRFCLVTTFYPPYNFGGDGIFVHQLANELAYLGHKVDVIHCIDSFRSLSHRSLTGNYTDHPNVTVHGLKSKFGVLSPLATQQTGLPLFKSKTLKNIFSKDFDVIHYHNISLLGPKILEYGTGLKLYTMHEYWLICPTHILFKFNRTICMKPWCFACNLIYKRPPQWWRYTDLLEKAIKHVDTFIAPSQFCKKIHLERGLDIPIVHLPNFVPSDDVSDSDYKLPDSRANQKPYFLFVGRLERLKGLQTIIPLFRSYPGAELIIAGKGNYEPQLRMLANGSDNIRFIGHQPKAQLRKIYKHAVALFVPSLCYEIFGLVIIEAFREKTPVIARDIGGLSEMLKNSGGGLTFNTEEDLAEAIEQLLADPSLGHKMGHYGYRSYLKKWTADAHLKQYLSLIHNLQKTTHNKM